VPAAHELAVLPDAEAVSRRGAEAILDAARVAVADRGSFALAVSGGRTPAAAFRVLGEADVAWERWRIWQVDERVAPDGHPDRNLTGLLAALPPEGRAAVRPMPVTDENLDAAAERYAAALPAAFDVVHLGLGEDGHTASLVPGDRVLEVADRDVAVTAEYRGRRRMTLTYRALDRAPFVLWLVTGADKAPALRRLLASDPSIPAGRVGAARQLVVADAAAASSRP
jgi:6-phosphogluconolactonase